MKIHPTSYGLSRDDSMPSSDAFAVESWGETIVAVLCDGAGTGTPARDAAQRAVHSLIENYQVRPRSWSPQRALHEFTQLITRTLHQESLARYDGAEMVSTLAVADSYGTGEIRLTVWQNFIVPGVPDAFVATTAKALKKLGFPTDESPPRKCFVACTGCKACVAACHSQNGLDEDESWHDVGLLLVDDYTPYQQTVTSGLSSLRRSRLRERLSRARLREGRGCRKAPR